ncbi:MAG: hypothetical protein WDW38_004157 [Sanguina aurantia]
MQLGLPHVKTNHRCTTVDGWELHIVHTKARDPVCHRLPVVLVPGLGSSGVYTWDLSPTISFADHLAGLGWDVFTVEMRGNGLSDKPSLMSHRSRWWSIDDCVDKDMPAALKCILDITGASKVHALGHSMGFEVYLALTGGASDSWWKGLSGSVWASRLLYSVPAGSMIRTYSHLAFTRAASPFLDNLYFSPDNVDPELARELLARNFSALSPGVCLQLGTAFDPPGLLTSDLRTSYADADLLKKVTLPVMAIVGDHDRMCPASGCLKTLSRFGSREKRYFCLGPDAGQKHHYGHFDILMGTNVQQEVFPLLTQWLERHDIITASHPPNKVVTAAAPMPAAVIQPALLIPVALTRMSHATPTPAAPAAAQGAAAAADPGVVSPSPPVLQLCTASAPEHASLHPDGCSHATGQRSAVFTPGSGFGKRAEAQTSKL